MVSALDISSWARVARFAAGLMLVVPLLAACSTNKLFSNGLKTKFSSAEYGVAASPLVAKGEIPKGGGRYTVGKPYKVAGRWYKPAEDPGYSASGTASWYGPNFHGRLTANGEVFDQYALSGAHPTLPLPSYVRVTNESNGRSVLVRINDRGPFAHGRVIDLSRRTAEVLGFIKDGTARVKVDYVAKAPLEGDDTRFLMASINTPTALERGGTRYAMLESAPIPAARPDFGWVTDLFSYAPENPVAGAHAAAEAMVGSVPQLQRWRDGLEKDGQAVTMALGAVESEVQAEELARRFALLAAVEISPVAGDGPGFALSATHLRPGVLPDDLLVLRGELGL